MKHLRSCRWDEWTSARIVGDPHSSVVDLPLVQVIGDRLVPVAAWYDNEYGFTAPLVEIASWLRNGEQQLPEGYPSLAATAGVVDVRA